MAKNEVATQEAASGISVAEMFQSMADLARDPNVDPQKMGAILDMQERMIDRQARMEFNQAMHKARLVMPVITKDGAITNKAGAVQSRFATYETIDKVVRPLAAEHGLTYGFNPSAGERGVVLVTCVVSHVGGWQEEFGPLPLAIDTTGSKNATQGAVSAQTYGKRATLCAAFNIVTMGADVDGATATTLPVQLEDKFQKLLDAGQAAAARGTAQYQAWFKSLSNQARGWMMDEGHHGQLKEAAEAHD
jgi:hypothetical protein